jgi:hypothetical protein
MIYEPENRFLGKWSSEIPTGTTLTNGPIITIEIPRPIASYPQLVDLPFSNRKTRRTQAALARRRR